VHNPGTIPHDNRLFAGADLICVFESPYPDFSNASSALQALPKEDINGYKRQNYAYMVSGVPEDWSGNQLGSFINSVKSSAQYLFITDINIQAADIYDSFGSSWEEFVSQISLTPAASITTK
jgi:hypothetical protein